MSSDKDDEELKKAEFYYEGVLRLEDLSQKSYERTNTKINIFIGVLSTVIPILTGIGYVVLSNTFALTFFVFFLTSLCILVWALAKCVHSLGPKWFTCIDLGYHMKANDKKSLSYTIFKVSSKWEDIIKRNFKKIGDFFDNLQQVVKLTIIGLTALIFAFLQLGLEYYVMPTLSQPPFSTMISTNEWQLVLLIVCFVFFVPIVSHILTSNGKRYDNTIFSLSTNEARESKLVEQTLELNDSKWIMERQVDSYLAWIGLWLVCLLGNVTILMDLALRNSPTTSIITISLILTLYLSLISGMIFSAYYVTFNVISPHIILINNLPKENDKLKNHILKSRTGLSQFFVNDKGVASKTKFVLLVVVHFIVFLLFFYFALAGQV